MTPKTKKGLKKLSIAGNKIYEAIELLPEYSHKLHEMVDTLNQIDCDLDDYDYTPQK